MANNSVVEASKGVTDALAGMAECASELSRDATYSVGPIDTHMAACDRLSRRLAQADALLYFTHGNGREAFECMNTAMQENFLSAVADLVSAAQVDAGLVTENARYRGNGEHS